MCRLRAMPWRRVEHQVEDLRTEVSGGFSALTAAISTLHGVTTSLSLKMEALMAAIDNLTAADTALQQEVVTFIQDWQNALANSDAANDAAVQQVATDMGNVVSQLQAADPSTPAPPPSN